MLLFFLNGVTERVYACSKIWYTSKKPHTYTFHGIPIESENSYYSQTTTQTVDVITNAI